MEGDGLWTMDVGGHLEQNDPGRAEAKEVHRCYFLEKSLQLFVLIRLLNLCTLFTSDVATCPPHFTVGCPPSGYLFTRALPDLVFFSSRYSMALVSDFSLRIKQTPSCDTNTEIGTTAPATARASSLLGILPRPRILKDAQHLHGGATLKKFGWLTRDCVVLRNSLLEHGERSSRLEYSYLMSRQLRQKQRQTTEGNITLTYCFLPTGLTFESARCSVPLHR